MGFYENFDFVINWLIVSRFSAHKWEWNIPDYLWRFHSIKRLLPRNKGVFKPRLVTQFSPHVRILRVYQNPASGCEAYGQRLSIMRLWYGSASNTLLTKIDSIQYQALRKVTDGLPMTSLAALQVECGEPPLEFCRQICVDKYKFDLQTRKDNHWTKNILFNRWRIW